MCPGSSCVLSYIYDLLSNKTLPQVACHLPLDLIVTVKMEKVTVFVLRLPYSQRSSEVDVEHTNA